MNRYRIYRFQDGREVWPRKATTDQPLQTVDDGFICTECEDEFPGIEAFMEHLVFDHDMDEYEAIDAATGVGR